jgi:hypothetical protein
MPIPTSPARRSPRADLYARLHEIGTHVPDEFRPELAGVAANLRRLHAFIPSDLQVDDDLLEIADRVDILAHPVVTWKG